MFRAQSIRRGAALAVVLVLLAAGAAQASATQIGWSKCFGGPFQCGTLQVPLDYAKPNGTTISLSVVRLPATDPAHRIGSLFLNPGGPGGSGVDYTVFAGPDLYTPEVRARFDLVGFDPRGIARSTALRCFGSPRQWEPAFQNVAFPLTPGELVHGSPPTAISSTPATSAVGRSSTTWPPRTWRATWIACAPRSATTAHLRGGLLRLLPRRHLREPVPGPGQGASSSTACSTRSPGRPAAATRRPRCRSRPGCRATSAHRPR